MESTLPQLVDLHALKHKPFTLQSYCFLRSYCVKELLKFKSYFF